MPDKAVILGVLDNGEAGLTEEHRRLLRQADVVIGARRTLDLFAGGLKNGVILHDLTGKLSQVPTWIAEALAEEKATVVLATGDPLCHGIANYLRKRCGLAKLDIRPNLSTLQLACARVGISWHDAAICSVHGKDAGEWADHRGRDHGLYPLLKACLRHDKVIAFTSPENSPARIARMLLAEELADSFTMIVAENLLQENESITADLPVRALAEREFSGLNMVILTREPASRPVLFGLEDASFAQRKPDKGLITKREVRAIALAQMQLTSDSIVWDIGAGSGSVGLEAARLCPDGWVYAIEKNGADVAIARENQRAMGIHHYTLLHAKAPRGLEEWPDPDAVFVGGSGGELDDLIRLLVARLRQGGHLVMNFVTLENLATAVAALKALGVAWQVTQIQAARSKPILHMHRMAAENPVWIVTVDK